MIVIRPVAEDDIANVALIYRDILQTVSWYVAHQPVAHQSAADAFAAATAGERIWVAVVQDKAIAGFISVWEADSFIHHLYVDPRFQRRGVGSALLESLTLPRPWSLKCAASNSAALAFYRSRGWQQVGRGDSETGPYLLMRF